MKIFKKLSVLALCIVIALMCTFSANAAVTGYSSQKQLEKQEIRDLYNALPTSNTVFEKSPSVTAPYSTGSLTKSFIDTGIYTLNFTRKLARLPQVNVSDAFNKSAQYGAVLMAANDVLSHTPEKPSGMSTDFYNAGYTATSQSNIFYSWGYNNKTILKTSVFSFLSDSDSFNIDVVGHRRWLLYPDLKTVGFGYATSQSQKSYVDLKIFDDNYFSSTAQTGYDCIAWPSSGNFPSEIFSAGDAWSVSLNSDKYARPNINSVKVTLTRQKDGKKWTFNSATGGTGADGTSFFNVDTQSYGINNCIIFRPKFESSSALIGKYTVKIEGIKTTAGKAAEISYTVDFFPLAECKTHSYVKDAVIKAPTCTADGKTAYVCTVCGYKNIMTEKAPGHSFDNGKITLKPTATKTGIKTFTCTVCGATKQSYIPATATLLGDADFNGKITAADARIALRAAVGLEKITPELLSVANVDGDDKITAADARIILRKSVGLDK